MSQCLFAAECRAEIQPNKLLGERASRLPLPEQGHAWLQVSQLRDTWRMPIDTRQPAIRVESQSTICAPLPSQKEAVETSAAVRGQDTRKHTGNGYGQRGYISTRKHHSVAVRSGKWYFEQGGKKAYIHWHGIPSTDVVED